MLKPERALRFLDAVDGLAGAARLAWAGHWGRRLRLGWLAAGFLIGVAAARLPLF